MSSTRSVFFIVNPCAGGGAAGRQWTRVQKQARDLLGPFQAVLTSGPGDATHLARRALLEGADLLVCVGGDGTLNEVVTGMMDGTGAIRPEASLGLISMGTGRDFIRTSRIPGDPERALEVIAVGRSMPLDLGKISYVDHQGQQASRYFLNVASFGLGGEVDERVGRTTKIFGGFVSFIWATLLSVLSYRKKTIRLRIDGSPEETVAVLNVAVANGQYHGGGMWIAPEASLSDGLFHVTVIGDFSIPEVFRHLPKLYNGRLFELEKVRTVTGKKIEARSDERVLLDVDGEYPGILPASLEIVPSALRVILP